MLQAARNLIQYHELIRVMAWRGILVRYKQAYLGILWAVLKPVMLLLIFILVRSFVGIDSGDVPYPLLTFAALLPWILFQESAAEGVNSVVGNANLIRKIYFPREIFPITSVVTKLIEFGITLFILAGLMVAYQFAPTVHILWLPVIVLYTLLAALTISLAGSALNVYYRDVVSVLPVALSLMMYLSPVMYPLQLVHKKLVVEQAAGEWSNLSVHRVHDEPHHRHHRQLPAHGAEGAAAGLQRAVAGHGADCGAAADELPVLQARRGLLRRRDLAGCRADRPPPTHQRPRCESLTDAHHRGRPRHQGVPARRAGGVKATLLNQWRRLRGLPANTARCSRRWTTSASRRAGRSAGHHRPQRRRQEHAC
jgi:lipopolysaccharide transport system permease protein